VALDAGALEIARREREQKDRIGSWADGDSLQPDSGTES